MKSKRFLTILFSLIVIFLIPLFAFGQLSCSGDAECDDLNPNTIDVCQRPGQANSGCSNLSCTVACLTDSDCGDGDDSTLDVCAGAGRCSATCSNLIACGNGVIDPGETSCNCPQDAGSCEGDASGVCNAFACVGVVCKNTLVLGCCGNGICETLEDYSSCSVDCKARSLEIKIEGISENDYYIRGEELLIRAIVTADGVAVNDARVEVEGFFGNLILLNNGNTNDGIKGDNIYANFLFVPNNIEADIYPLTFNTVFENNRGIKIFNLTVEPKLEITLNLVKEEIFLGGAISASGVVSKKTTAIKSDVMLAVYSNDILVSKETISTNDLGEFSYSYRTSFLDNEGEWRVEAFTKDELENTGFGQRIVTVLESEVTAFLNVALVKEIEQTYVRGEDLFLSVSVADGVGTLISEAQVSVLLPSGVSKNLEEVEEGVFEGTIEIGLDFPLGVQKLTINALKTDGNNFFAGSTNVEFVVEQTEILVEITDPIFRSVQIGDEIDFRVVVTYPNKKPVILSEINSTINGQQIVLNAVEQGVYAGKYIVTEMDAPKILFEVSVDDSYGNVAIAELEVEVSGISFAHYLRTFGIQLGAIIVILLIMTVILVLVFSKKRKLSTLNQSEKKILAELKTTQTEYFKEGTLDRKNYDRLMEKYELELEDVRKSIAQSKKIKKKKV